MPRSINNNFIDNKNSNNILFTEKIEKNNRTLNFKDFFNKSKSNILEVQVPPILFKKSLPVTENYLKLKLEKKDKFIQKNRTIEDFWENLFSILLKSKSFTINNKQNISILGFETRRAIKNLNTASPYLNLESIPIYLIKSNLTHAQANVDSKIWEKKIEDIIFPPIAEGSTQIPVFASKKEAKIYLNYLRFIDPYMCKKNKLSLEVENLKSFYKRWKTDYSIFALINSLDKKKNFLFISNEQIKINENLNIFLVSFSRDILETSLKSLGYKEKNYKKLTVNSFFSETSKNINEKYFFIPNLDEKNKVVNKKDKISFTRPVFLPVYWKNPFLICFNETLINVGSIDNRFDNANSRYTRENYLFADKKESHEHHYTTNRWYEENYAIYPLLRSLRSIKRNVNRLSRFRVLKTNNELLFSLINFRRLRALKKSKNNTLQSVLSIRGIASQSPKDLLDCRNEEEDSERELNLEILKESIKNNNNKIKKDEFEIDEYEDEWADYFQYYRIISEIRYKNRKKAKVRYFSPYATPIFRKKSRRRLKNNSLQRFFILNSLSKKTKKNPLLVKRFSSSYPIYGLFYQNQARKIYLPLEYNLNKKSKLNIFKSKYSKLFIRYKHFLEKKD